MTRFIPDFVTNPTAQGHRGMTCFPPPSEGGPIENFEQQHPASTTDSHSRCFLSPLTCYPSPIEMLSLAPFSPFLLFLTSRGRLKHVILLQSRRVVPRPHFFFLTLSLPLSQPLLRTTSYCSCVVPRSSLPCVSVASVSRIQLYSFDQREFQLCLCQRALMARLSFDRFRRWCVYCSHRGWRLNSPCLTIVRATLRYRAPYNGSVFRCRTLERACAWAFECPVAV